MENKREKIKDKKLWTWDRRQEIRDWKWKMRGWK